MYVFGRADQGTQYSFLFHGHACGDSRMLLCTRCLASFSLKHNIIINNKQSLNGIVKKRNQKAGTVRRRYSPPEPAWTAARAHRNWYSPRTMHRTETGVRRLVSPPSEKGKWPKTVGNDGADKQTRVQSVLGRVLMLLWCQMSAPQSRGNQELFWFWLGPLRLRFRLLHSF